MPYRTRKNGVSPVWVAFTAIALGSCIYLSWRVPDILVFRWIAGIGLTGPTDVIRAVLAPVRTCVPDIIVFSLPAALWAFALVTMVMHIWQRRPCAARNVWLGIAIGFAAYLEIGQAFNIVPGTFDWCDLSLTGAAVLIPLLRSPS